MNWNLFNTPILAACLLIIAISFPRFLLSKGNRAAFYLHGFILLANLVIVQVLLIDIGIAKRFPSIQLFYLPFQFLSPVFFTAFTFAYLNQNDTYKKYRKLLWVPFVFFFLVYSFFKVNIIGDYPYLSKQAMAQFGYEWDENLSLFFALLLGLWNYKIIRDYENGLSTLPYGVVIKKTVWLKRSYSILVLLCVLWALVILFLKIKGVHYGHFPYYPLWSLFLIFYYGFCFLGSKHLKKVESIRLEEEKALIKMSQDFRSAGLERIFTLKELESKEANLYETTGVLSYFATSLFDKNNTEDVLWDIVYNCISRLNLEDCVIYLIDKERRVLLQKAAFGNKQQGERKILSPIKIPLGKGIVGTVALKRQAELVHNLSKDARYIKDDLPRQSELAVPILYKDELFGVLDSEHSQRNFFTKRHLYLFELIAKLTALKLQQMAKNSILTLTNDNAYYVELVRLLEREKIYRDPDLSLTSTARKLDISSGYLSQLINTLSGFNFSDLINSYRVHEAEKMLKDPKYLGYTIRGIGLEAGFNSKSAFYTSFKKHTGSTPSQYRESLLELSRSHSFQ